MTSKDVFARLVRSFVCVLLILVVAMTMTWPVLGWARSGGQENPGTKNLEVTLTDSPAASALTGYYNLMGFEGIGTVGSHLTSNGQTPPVADWSTTHCRYIDVANTVVGDYYLRYPLHLPHGVTITKVSVYMADFAGASGRMWSYLRYRNWNSRDAGTTLGFASCCTTDNDHTANLTLTGGANLKVNNQTKEYWIDVSPEGAVYPYTLCVYGIQVTFTYDSVMLPLILKGA